MTTQYGPFHQLTIEELYQGAVKHIAELQSELAKAQMTSRDQFAMAANERDLIAFTPRAESLNREYGPKWRTEARYLFADAMLKERAK